MGNSSQAAPHGRPRGRSFRQTTPARTKLLRNVGLKSTLKQLQSLKTCIQFICATVVRTWQGSNSGGLAATLGPPDDKPSRPGERTMLCFMLPVYAMTVNSECASDDARSSISLRLQRSF